MSRRISEAPERPWYREPWPWILMSLPAAAVVAGIVTYWLASSTFDGLVEDDYYKRGLAINRMMERDQAAQRLGLGARAVLEGGGLAVRVELSSTAGAPLPETLSLRLVHPTRPGMDQQALLTTDGRGGYRGELNSPGPGRWRVTIEDPQRSWRLSGDWQLPEASQISMGAYANDS